MENKKRYSFKKILFSAVWFIVGVATVVLLVAAIRKNDSKKCRGIKINITGIENTLFNNEKFVDEKDIHTIIQKVSISNPIGKAIGSINLKQIETELEKSKWVKNAELFFDNNDVLKVTVQEKEPVARIFTTGGTSFYIDTALAILPLSNKFSARLPVFTGFPSDKIVLTPEDSVLLNDIKDISIAIQKDSFRMAMIDQVDVTPQNTFEMIPKIGNQVIVFGNASDIEDKFNKLQLFYKKVLLKTGWGRYSQINVQFKNQVVAKIRGAEDKSADSVRTLQIMQLIAANAERQAEDSVQTIIQDGNNNITDSSMILQSIQREDITETSNAIINNTLQPANNTPVVKQPAADPLPSAKLSTVKTVTPKPVPVKTKPTVTKPVTQNSSPVKKPVPVKPEPKKPKAVMPIKNEY